MSGSETCVLDGLGLGFVRATEAAAYAASKMAGRGDQKGADQVAVDAMRNAMNAMDIDGEIVIGEGERDEAPMLYIGEKVGTGKGPAVDIALDPLEGTTLTAKGAANALAVVAVAEKGGLLNAPDTYMEKIAIGGGYPEGVVDLDADAADNIRALAKAKGVDTSDICACILDRPRHEETIGKVRSTGARVKLISDGDVAGVINTTDPSTGVDIYMGVGGAPEGVLAAAALRAIGGQLQARLVFRNDDERGRADRIGITDFDKKYSLNELAKSDVLFVASGVTDGSLLGGVQVKGGQVRVDTLLLSSFHHDMRWIRGRHPLSTFGD
jgi:fructose-1,6-bisphosphatase II / sedoheptulose-1,7-bisphosphatase